MCCRYYMEMSPELRPIVEEMNHAPLAAKMRDKLGKPLTTVGEVFDAAMALTDELNLSTGSARTRDTKEYEQRTPQIIGTLIAEFRLMSGLRGSYIRPESLDDNLIGIDDGYAIGVMQYGLAAKLLLDENPASAAFFHEKYEELRGTEEPLLFESAG